MHTLSIIEMHCHPFGVVPNKMHTTLHLIVQYAMRLSDRHNMTLYLDFHYIHSRHYAQTSFIDLA